ncbi:hypothetical protein [Xanthomonas phage RTH11]|nr:hypothetical protein [Xanthomonas phage RTH11]
MAKETELRKIARNPRKWYNKQPLHSNLRQAGKTALAFAFSETVFRLVFNHPQRMRGLFVHARKGKFLRPHKRRTSWVDAR